MTQMRKPFPSMLDAIYREAVDPSQRGNICVEALPRFVSAEDMSRVFGNYPPFDAKERSLSKAERTMRVLTLRNLFEPLAQHEELCDSIGKMIRHGYSERNPVDDSANRRMVEPARPPLQSPSTAVPARARRASSSAR